jgi:phosphoribosylformimino-5-aminoimidazole carboxamide ribotide isomerase
MRLIPVLDVLNGIVVRGIGGRRREYRPIVSQLTSSTDPIEVARALIDAAQPQEVYLADLDAMVGRPVALDVYRAILALGVRLWVDAGIRDANGAKLLAEGGCDVVAGLETVVSLEALRAIVDEVGTERMIFSLDLRDGVPLRDWRAERRKPPDPGQDRDAYASTLAVAQMAIATGITRLIVLDIARVGGGGGTGTDDLCREIAKTYPHAEVIAGGGVAGPEDLRRLEACGVKGVLAASALHDKRLLSTQY